jgi:hypothetical protein
MVIPGYVEEAVADALKASPAVSELCPGGVHPLKIPQKTKLPAIVYQRTYTSPDYTLSGYTSEAVVLMVNCFAMTWTDAKKLAMAVRSVMAAAPVHALLRDEIDLYEENAGAACISAEYLCQQSGGFCHGNGL